MRCHNDVPMYAMLAAAAAAGDENDNDRTENCAGAWRSATNVDDGRVQSVSTINAQPVALCRARQTITFQQPRNSSGAKIDGHLII